MKSIPFDLCLAQFPKMRYGVIQSAGIRNLEQSRKSLGLNIPGHCRRPGHDVIGERSDHETSCCDLCGAVVRLYCVRH